MSKNVRPQHSIHGPLFLMSVHLRNLRRRAFH
jgi:hypothetical protein